MKDAESGFQGTLHIYVAFDWGEEVDLPQARQLVSAEWHDLSRRRRTPTSFAFRPTPLRIRLKPAPFDIAELGSVTLTGDATIFDFAAVSIAFQVAFDLSHTRLKRLAGWLAEPAALLQLAREILAPLHQRLLPAIRNPNWQDDLSEEYFVFHISTATDAVTSMSKPPPTEFAPLLRLEEGSLSEEECAEAVRLRLRYGQHDLFVADWAAAILIDCDCDETLQTIEFANLQLLEYRHIDNQLDESLAAAYGLLHPKVRARLPFFRSQSRALRALGELKLDAAMLYERTSNVLKLVGDQYLARVYRMLASRFHLEEWEQTIQRKLEVAESAYTVVSDQAATNRLEMLEAIVVILILLELIVAFVRH